MNSINDNHKIAALHSEEASKLHHEASKHYEAGNHEKAHLCTLLANSHTVHTVQAESEIVKQHTVK